MSHLDDQEQLTDWGSGLVGVWTGNDRWHRLSYGNYSEFEASSVLQLLRCGFDDGRNGRFLNQAPPSLPQDFANREWARSSFKDRSYALLRRLWSGNGFMYTQFAQIIIITTKQLLNVRCRQSIWTEKSKDISRFFSIICTIFAN